MGPPGFFDADKRLAALSKKGDPLEAIAALVPWESFRADIEAVVLTPEPEKKSNAGRKPFDAIQGLSTTFGLDPMNTLSRDQQIAVISALTEGMSIRATERARRIT